MFNKEELDEWLAKVGANIVEPVNAYMIGGYALSFKGLKAATKDIDIILALQQDFNVFDKAMKATGFKSMAEKESEFYATALAVYVKDDNSRIDVFLNQVGKMLKLTSAMVHRAEKYKQYGNLTVYLISNEDIFLFKAMTSRPGDLLDCDRLMKENLDYKKMYTEIEAQSSFGKHWFFWMYESICRLENYNNIRMPIKKKVFRLVKKHWNDRPSDFMEDIESREEHIAEKKR